MNERDVNDGRQIRLGVVGCGNVLDLFYLPGVQRLAGLRVVAFADADTQRAQRVSEKFAGSAVMSADELVKASNVDVVLNLTTPASHHEVTLAAIAAGKHVYSEKPLATSISLAQQILDASDAARVRVGCAPDTVLGTGVQTARDFIDSGELGLPTAASASLMLPGHELWHPNPDFYYLAGGGPVLDMGPYYLTALFHLLGPVQSVQAMSSRPLEVRTIKSGNRAGEAIPVEVDTHVTCLLRHAEGAISTLTLSFDAPNTRAPFIEVHGTNGSLSVPDPDQFHGRVEFSTTRGGDWQELPVSAGYQDSERGVGLADMLTSASHGVAHRASAEIAFHVLEVMTAIAHSAEHGDRVAISTRPPRPPLVTLQSVPSLEGASRAAAGGRR
jgi:predicted dehydrogenase